MAGPYMTRVRQAQECIHKSVLIVTENDGRETQGNVINQFCQAANGDQRAGR